MMGIRSDKSMPRLYKCRVCKESYAMDWAKQNHEKQCRERLRERWEFIEARDDDE